jgi:hypothetical protein
MWIYVAWGGDAKINGIHCLGPWNVHHGHIEYLKFFKLYQAMKVQDLGNLGSSSQKNVIKKNKA